MPALLLKTWFSKSLKVDFQLFLNQVRPGHRLAHAWFLTIDPVRIVGMHVCVCVGVYMSTPEAINN